MTHKRPVIWSRTVTPKLPINHEQTLFEQIRRSFRTELGKVGFPKIYSIDYSGKNATNRSASRSNFVHSCRVPGRAGTSPTTTVLFRHYFLTRSGNEGRAAKPRNIYKPLLSSDERSTNKPFASVSVLHRTRVQPTRICLRRH